MFAIKDTITFFDSVVQIVLLSSPACKIILILNWCDNCIESVAMFLRQVCALPTYLQFSIAYTLSELLMFFLHWASI